MTKPIDYRTICKKCGKPHYHLPTEVYQLCDNCQSIKNQVIKYPEEENKILRGLLWAAHPCMGKYCDDGELQCGACMIDFKREPIERIEAKLFESGLRRLSQAKSSESASPEMLLTDEEIQTSIRSDKKRVSGWTPTVTPRDFVIAEAQLAKAEPLIRADEREKVLAVYDKYVKLLSDELDEIATIASVHGWHTTREEDGVQCRKEIAELKSGIMP